MVLLERSLRRGRGRGWPIHAVSQAPRTPSDVAHPIADVHRRDGESRFGRAVWLLLALTPLMVLGQLSGINLIDAWWNFALGHLMFAQGQLVTSDPFSFTPTVAEAINQQWLAQLAWAAAYDGAGPVGVYALRAATILVTGAALWSIGRMLGASRRALLAASLIGAFQIAEFFQIRAQVFAFALAAGVLWCLQRGGRTAWLAVPLTVLWANVHGSFPLACCFAAAFAVGSVAQTRSRAAQYTAIAALAALGTLFNPYGLQVWRYAVDLSSNEALRSHLNEWAPTTVQDFSGKLFFASFAAGSALLAWRRPRVPLSWLLLTGALAVFALTAVRNIPWFALVAFPVWALLLSGSFVGLTDHVTRPRTLRVLAAGIVAALLIGGWPIARQLEASPNASVSDQELALSDLTTYLQQHPQHALFHDANWGAYLEAHLSPTQQVFIDTRFEVHPISLWNDYYAVMNGRFDWQSILDTYGIQRVAVDQNLSPNLVRALQASGTWSEVWRTDRGSSHMVVWTKDNA